MASDEGIENLRVFNAPMSLPVSYNAVSDIKSKLNDARGVEESEEIEQEEEMDMSELEDMPDIEEGFIQRKPSNEGFAEEQV